MDLLPAAAEELVRLKVDVIVTGTEAAARARSKPPAPYRSWLSSQSTIPLPPGLSKVSNRPGGNVTGLTVRNSLLAGKRLELLKEMLPGLTRVGVLLGPVRPRRSRRSRVGGAVAWHPASTGGSEAALRLRRRVPGC